MVPVGITEDKPAQNLNAYALSKYATERISVSYAEVLSIPTVAFRYFNVYGPRQSLSNPYTGVVAIFLSRLKNKNPPIVFEDGMQLRDFIYVDDIARHNVMAIENQKAEGVYNLGTGKPITLLDIIEKLNKLIGTNITPHIPEDFRPGDNRHDYSDISRLKKTFGDGSFVGIEEGMKKLAEWSENVEAVDNLEKAERERKRFLK